MPSPRACLLTLCLGLGLAGPAFAVRSQEDPALPAGRWRAVLQGPGGELPFGLLARDDGSVAIENGPERIEIPVVRREGATVVLEMPHYDSRLTAELDPAGATLTGQWVKRASGAEAWTRMDFRAARGDEARFAPDPGQPGAAWPETSVDGRWRVRFESSDTPAVGVFETLPSGELGGTFLTSTGDYRFLAGRFEHGRLRLSVFDGAHAFLFDARLESDGALAGDFWSRDTWHETWRATRDDAIELPDPYAQTAWTPGVGLADLVFPDPAGEVHCVAELAAGHRVTILQVFGSWCPNCHDESAYLAELYRRRAADGLQVIGLAFELTGDFARDAEQVRRFADKYALEFPLLVAGLADKSMATAALRALDEVRSYPTAIFLDGAGRVRSVHTGFTGPATGANYERVRAEFEGLVDELLAEPPADDSETFAWLSETGWAAPFREGRTWLTFERDEAGAWHGVTAAGREPARLFGDTLLLGEPSPLVLRIDRAAEALIDPHRFGHRVLRATAEPPYSRILEGAGLASPEGLRAALFRPEPELRREALYSLGRGFALRAERGEALHDSGVLPLVELLSDEDPGVCVAAAWAAGRIGAASRLELRAALLAAGRTSDPALRREATLALRPWRADEQVGQRLRELVLDPHPWVRSAAIELLQPTAVPVSR